MYIPTLKYGRHFRIEKERELKFAIICKDSKGVMRWYNEKSNSTKMHNIDIRIT